MARAECAFGLLAHNPPGSLLACVYVSELGVRVAGVFLVRVAMRGRGGVVSGRGLLGLGRLDIACGAQLGDGAGEGVGVLDGELLQGLD